MGGNSYQSSLISFDNMRKILFLFFIGCIIFETKAENSWKSPNNRNEIKVINTDDKKYAVLSSNSKEISRFIIEGEISGVFWSPKEKYLAFNEHNGHLGWYLWVINLETGKVVYPKNIGLNANGEAYDDNPSYFSDTKKLKKFKKNNLAEDRSIIAPYGVAYGWNKDGKLLFINIFSYINLWSDSSSELVEYVTLSVGNDVWVSSSRFEVIHYKNGFGFPYPQGVINVLEKG